MEIFQMPDFMQKRFNGWNQQIVLGLAMFFEQVEQDPRQQANAFDGWCFSTTSKRL
jgi:hypothetical protein